MKKLIPTCFLITMFLFSNNVQARLDCSKYAHSSKTFEACTQLNITTQRSIKNDNTKFDQILSKKQSEMQKTIQPQTQSQQQTQQSPVQQQTTQPKQQTPTEPLTPSYEYTPKERVPAPYNQNEVPNENPRRIQYY